MITNEISEKELVISNSPVPMIKVTHIYERPRYEGRINYDSHWYCKDVIDNLLNSVKIWTPCSDFSTLCNVEINDDIFTGNLEKDLEIFEGYISKEYPGEEYNAYVLGAYIHSSVSFSISKEGDHRCKFDSGQLGFIAIPKDKDMFYNSSSINKIVKDLDDAWNGYYVEYYVYDNFLDEIINSNITSSLDNIEKYKAECKTKYGVTFD